MDRERVKINDLIEITKKILVMKTNWCFSSPPNFVYKIMRDNVSAKQEKVVTTVELYIFWKSSLAYTITSFFPQKSISLYLRN